ncbi:MAG: response regulator transcription factor [Dehalococcoidales bacterium]|nr:response regulator transcription factor [Dehalococcoidales bacterium]
MDKIVVALVDKQALFRIGVHYALSQQPDIEVFHTSPDQNLAALTEAIPPDVMLLDIDYPSLRGLDIAREIVRRYPATRIIILTSDPDDEQLLEIVKSGAVAYLDRNITAEELTGAIRQVFHGEYLISESLLAKPRVSEYILRQFQSLYGTHKRTADTITAILTEREKQVLNHVAAGNSNKQIASILEISEQTIKNHVSNILRKLNANDRTHAVFLAVRHGWIMAGDSRLPTHPVTQQHSY